MSGLEIVGCGALTVVAGAAAYFGVIFVAALAELFGEVDRLVYTVDRMLVDIDRLSDKRKGKR